MYLQMYDQCLNIYDVTFVSALDLPFAFICLTFYIGESIISSMIHGTLYFRKGKGKFQCEPLSPRHGASSGCGWRNGLLYGG
jgi:hypothetical protein